MGLKTDWDMRTAHRHACAAVPLEWRGYSGSLATDADRYGRWVLPGACAMSRVALPGLVLTEACGTHDGALPQSLPQSPISGPCHRITYGPVGYDQQHRRRAIRSMYDPNGRRGGGGLLEGGGGVLGPKNLCTPNGPTRFPQRYISLFPTMATLGRGGGVRGGAPPTVYPPPLLHKLRQSPKLIRSMPTVAWTRA